MRGRVPIYQQVAQLLEARIERGEYAVGQYLPPERDLARELGVNRRTLRQAIGELVRRGLVRREARRGHRLIGSRGRAGGLLALIVYDMARGSSAQMFQGCHQAVMRSGYHLIVCETWRGPRRDVGDETEQLRRLIARPVDGIIAFMEPTAENRALLELALARGIHVVQIDRCLPGLECDYVGVDNVTAAAEIVRYLIELGHRRIGVVGTDPPASTTVERLTGYAQALAEVGLAPDPALAGTIPIRRPHPLLYRELVRRWQALPEPPTAVFALNDEHAMRLIQAARAEGLDVPGDLSVVGFDNQPLATLVQPPLTTVAQPFFHLGETSAQLLIDRLRGDQQGPPRRILLPTQLVVRESAAAPRCCSLVKPS